MSKIKQFFGSDKGKDILVILIVILVGVGSFELGRLSKKADSSGIKIEYKEVLGGEEAGFSSGGNRGNENAVLGASTGKEYFASSRGQKYYSIGCSGGKTIKPENKIYFASKAEAERAGYELSSSCK
jgi:hypothetical protein